MTLPRRDPIPAPNVPTTRPERAQPPDLAAIAAVWAAGLRARDEYRKHPTAFAVDPLCETCQTRPRYGRLRKCSGCWKRAAVTKLCPPREKGQP